MKWNNDTNMNCPLCELCNDSHEHLFFKCNFSKEIWKEFIRRMKPQRRSFNWKEIIGLLADEYKDRSVHSVVGRLMFGAYVYYMWRERNKRIFTKEKRNVETMIEINEDSVKIRMISLGVLKNAHVIKMLSDVTLDMLFVLAKRKVSCFENIQHWQSFGHFTWKSSEDEAARMMFGLRINRKCRQSDTVMSDSEDSTITYTAVSSLFGGLSDIRSLGVDGPLLMPEDLYAYVVAAFHAPPSPDYVPGPKYPPLLEFVPEPVYPEFMPPDDNSDPEEDPEEDDEDPEEDPVDYPADGGDDGDDEDESSDDNVDIEGEEDHPAPANSTVVDHAPSAEETVSFETDKLLAIPSPPPSPLSPWSSPLPVSSPVPVSPLPLLVSPIRPLGYRAAMIQLRVEAPPTSHSPPLPPPIIHSHTRSDAPPPGTPPLLPRLGIALGLRYKGGESLSAPTAGPPGGFRADYGMPGAPATDDSELGQRMREFATMVGQDTNEIYTRLDDEQTEQQLLAEAWGRSMDASDLARAEVMSLHTTVLGQQAVITELQAADRKRQAMISELQTADRRRQTHFIEALKLLKRLQTQMTEFEGQQGPTKGPAQPDAPEEAGSSP
ncbi:hypothetical protein Tco_0475472 [Tanacetum coccineum]